METMRETLNAALKAAMIAKDSPRRDLIRQLLSAIKQVEIDTQKDVANDDVLVILQKEAKRRREAIDEATKAGRQDIAESEQAELIIIESFLPQQLTLDELKAIAAEIVAEVGATSAKDQGKIMGPLMARVKGLADGKLVNQAVREILNG
jgi:uncharacterized protein YqeY